jgi:phage shock protein A
MSDDPNQRLDTDISGMEPEAAKEYVLAFITTLKTTRRQKQAALEEKKLWQERVSLAQSKQEAELALKAGRRVEEIQAKIATLENEERELEPKVDVLKEQLLRLVRTPQMSVDAEGLLAQLQMLVGEPDTVAESFKHEEANIELEKLKKKMQGDEQDP